MSTEKFDKRLRNLFSQYEARIDKNDWERMNGYLQARNRRRKRNIFFSLLMLLMTVPYFLSAFYTNSAQLGSRLPLDSDQLKTSPLAKQKGMNEAQKFNKLLAEVEANGNADPAQDNASPEARTETGLELKPDEAGQPGAGHKYSAPQSRKKSAQTFNSKKDKYAGNTSDTNENLTDAGSNGIPAVDNIQVNDSTDSKKDISQTAELLKDSIDAGKTGPPADDPAKKKKLVSPAPCFLISLRFTPGVAGINKSVRAGHEKQVHDDYNDVKAQERNRFGFETSIDFSYRLISNLSLRSGFNYRLSGQHNVYDYKIEKIPVIDAATKNILAYIKVNDTTGQNHIKAGDRSSLSWVSIPLVASWQIPLGPRFSLRLESGVEGSFLAAVKGTQASYDDLQRKKLKASDFKRMTWGYNVNAAFIFPLSGAFSAAVCPSYSKLSDFSRKESTFKTSSSQVGLGFSLMFNLSSIKN